MQVGFHVQGVVTLLVRTLVSTSPPGLQGSLGLARKASEQRRRLGQIGLPRWLSNKESSAMQEMLETQVLSLGWENPLEEKMATHSSTLARKSP